MRSNSLYVAIISSIVAIVLTAAVIIPIINEGSYSSQKIDNDPVTYVKNLTEIELKSQELSITYDNGLNVTINGTSYAVGVPAFSSVFVSDGVNVSYNGTNLDVYGNDGVKYPGQSISKVRGDTITITDSSSAQHTCPVPSYCYISIGKSDDAKRVQTSGLYVANDKTKLDDSSVLVMIGKQDGNYGVSARGTVIDYKSGERNGGVIYDKYGNVYVPVSKADVKELVDDYGYKTYTIDGGTIKEVTI